jgi:SAM-dependent methyltransferase
MLNDFEDPTDLVAAGYDEAGGRYTEAALRENLAKDLHTRILLDRLPEGSRVLDLGCGSGRPTTAILAERFHLTGVDVSSRQVERARQAIPNARFVEGDMSRLEFEDASFDGVVAFYSIIHVPRDRQQALFESIHSWLRPGGILVASLASTGSEAWTERDFFGASMYWSSYDPGTSERMLKLAGFHMDSAELIEQEFDGKIETHLWVVARRPFRPRPTEPLDV